MQDVKPKAWIGVDPGKTGAAALISEFGELDLADWPGDAPSAAAIIREWAEAYEVQFAYLERQQPMRRNGRAQGVASTGKIMNNFGIWEGILAMAAIPYRIIPPKEWQAGLLRKADGADTKKQSLAVARRMFPAASASLARNQDHGRSDAALIAWRATRDHRVS